MLTIHNLEIGVVMTTFSLIYTTLGLNILNLTILGTILQFREKLYKLLNIHNVLSSFRQQFVEIMQQSLIVSYLLSKIHEFHEILREIFDFEKKMINFDPFSLKFRENVPFSIHFDNNLSKLFKL